MLALVGGMGMAVGAFIVTVFLARVFLLDSSFRVNVVFLAYSMFFRISSNPSIASSFVFVYIGVGKCALSNG